jgi:tetratricopeptide (TPR) repeat protein
MVRTALLVVLLVLAAAAGTARADARAEARLRMERAAELHRNGKFADALNELTVAYALDPRPEMLYGIGQLHVALGNCAQAILFYERFLSTRPDPLPAAAATEAIETCRRDPDSLKDAPAPEPGSPAEPPPPPAAEPPPAEPPPAGGPTRWYTDKLGGALLGGGVVLGAIAVATYASARSDLDAAEAAPDVQTHDELAGRARDKRTIAAVLGVAGVGLAGAAVTRYVLVRRAGAPAAVGVTPAPGGGGLVTWRVRF